MDKGISGNYASNMFAGEIVTLIHWNLAIKG